MFRCHCHSPGKRWAPEQHELTWRVLVHAAVQLSRFLRWSPLRGHRSAACECRVLRTGRSQSSRSSDVRPAKPARHCKHINKICSRVLANNLEQTNYPLQTFYSVIVDPATNHDQRCFFLTTIFIPPNSLFAQCLWNSAHGAIKTGLLVLSLLL